LKDEGVKENIEKTEKEINPTGRQDREKGRGNRDRGEDLWGVCSPADSEKNFGEGGRSGFGVEEKGKCPQEKE